MHNAIILVECLESLVKEEKTAVNDAAFRKQFRILTADPGVKHALCHARDAPVEPPIKPKRKRTPKPSPDD